MLQFDTTRIVTHAGGVSGLRRLLAASNLTPVVPPKLTVKMWHYRRTIPRSWLPTCILAVLKHRPDLTFTDFLSDDPQDLFE